MSKKMIVVLSVLPVVLLALLMYGLYELSEYYSEKERLESMESSKERISSEIQDIVDGILKEDTKRSGYEVMDNVREKEVNLIDFTESYEDYFTEDEEKFVDNISQELNKIRDISISKILTKNPSRDDYESLKKYRKEDWLSDDNKRVLEEFREEISAENDRIFQDAKERLGDTVKTGHSEVEVFVIMGEPSKKFKTEEAEFWTYGNTVLTMKNGYVFQINSND